MIITIDDIVKAGICATGARRWFRLRGLNFRDFMDNGIDAEVLLATGDAYAQQVVNHKLGRLNNG